jgi:hypothetical protein
MKKILFIFLTACFFFSCEKETIVIPQQHAGRTVLAFFWADNSLNSNLRNNIRTMMQGLQAMKDSAALLVYWDGEASDISWPEPCIVEYVTNGQGGINSMSKEAVNAMIADQDMSVGSRLDKYWQYQKKIFPSDIDGENRHADSDR